MPHDGAHLVAHLGIAPCFGRLPLQRAQLLLDFDYDVVYARQIDFGRFELGFREAFLGLEFGNAGSFLDDGAPLHRLGGENLPDAPLLDDGVGIRSEAYAHEHVLNVPQPRRPAINEVFALSRTI